ncbi:sterol carrier family protein [Naasia sp. SYSU D00948]|uniref:sterol carrier family protein n=1 Tax=Naasia sp. SYSU D00948 TaxID=2817379 RepID=UPI001B317FA7|nr:sterol carrier family protein [Naasia sp. SYSU D00948]
MGRARIAAEVGEPAVLSALRGDAPRPVVATAVRYTLQLLAERAEGGTVEVRVPPFGAVQCIPGPRHTRGTPPNVIETDPETWLALAAGSLDWAEALASHRVSASGSRADLTGWLPLPPIAALGARA